MNRAFCNTCGELVPAEPRERDGKVFLIKDCPECGPNETLISADGARYYAKRALDTGYQYRGCRLDCLTCKHDRKPSTVFVDITNRCNMNCPICLNNTPSMGFEFEPPMEYFERIFEHLSKREPRPVIELFGGEPTVREDLFDIIALAKSYGLRTRVVTNGVKLADEDYCRQLAETGTILLLSYDGENPETYRTLRGSARFLELKRKAVENVARLRRGKVGLIACIGKGLNDHQLGEIIGFCHRFRHCVRRILLMPLAQTWDRSQWDYVPERMTTEDVENLVARAFPQHRVEFLPAGFVGQFSAVLKYLGREPPPWAGAHPNCESTYLLLSDGEKYVPVEQYLRSSLTQFGQEFNRLDQALERREKRWQTAPGGRVLAALRLRKAVLRSLGLAQIALFFARRVRFGRLLKGSGVAKLGHGAMLFAGLLLGRKTRKLLERHTNVQAQLQVVTLPFEDVHVLETDRLERCPSQQAYFDPRTEKVGLVPLCAWNEHKRRVLREVAQYYAARAASYSSLD